MCRSERITNDFVWGSSESKRSFTGVHVNRGAGSRRTVRASLRAVRRRVLPLLTVLLAGCGGAAQPVEPPGATLQRYVAAVRAGDEEAAYALLDEETRAEVGLEGFRELMQENREELRDQASELESLASQGVEAQARVPLETGETAVLVLEEGRWVLDGGVLDAPALRTPRDAVLSLRRSLRRRSLRGVERVLARQPRAELEAEIDRILEDTADERDLRIEVQGNQARVLTTSGREILLVREAGEWRILRIE